MRLWIEEAGTGPAVLCISGLGYSNWCWRETIAALSPSYRVVPFDNRGTGRSDAPEDGYSIEEFAYDAAGVLRDKNAAPADVIGHSMGGYIALTLAARHPSLVRSLVLIGTGAGGEGWLPLPDATQAAWKAAVEKPPSEFARETMPLSFATGWSEAHPERFDRLLAERLAHPTPTAIWKKQFRAAGAFGRDGIDASRIDKPALVIHGSDDRVIRIENGRRLASQLPQGRLVELAGAGHLCFLEAPGTFQHLLVEWLGTSRPMFTSPSRV